MANFAVPKFEGIQQAGQQYADTLTRIAMMKREERLRADEQRTQAILGASTGDIATFVPEAREQLAAARTSKERIYILSKAAQLAQARSMQHTDLLNKAKAVGSGISATGMSDPAALADQQTALVTSGLPPDIIAQIQSSLGTQASLGSAEFARVKEERAYRDTEQAEERGFARSENDRVFNRNQAAQLEAEGRQRGDEIAREGRMDERAKAREQRAIEQGDLEARRTYAVKLGVPWSSKKPAEWPEINSAVLYSLENEGKPQPKEVRAANRQLIDAVTFENKNKKRTGDITDASVMGRARDLNTQASAGGSDLVVIPVITNESGLTNWQEDVRLEALPWQEARVELARVYQVAQSEGEGSEAAKYIGHIVSLASTSDSPALKAMLASQVTPEQAAAIKETKDAQAATQTAPAAPKSARERGRGVGASVRRALAPSAAGAERAARAVGESQRKAGESARQSNRRLKEGLVGVYEGLTGDE